jgi:ABC-type methionine transport system ATPase subunit|tara:strand:- start:136 stop:360 length:225 start_codon:yes stop_codon:yes gene_type:complete
MMVKLTFPQKLIKEPIIYRMGEKFDIIPSIYQGVITEKALTGWVVLDLAGNQNAIDEALEWVRSLGVTVDEQHI